MSRLEAIMRRFEGDPYRRAPNDPVKLISYIGSPVSAEEIERAWRPARAPVEAIELWSVCNTAHFFLDIDFGQWGLRLLGPWGSAAKTRRLAAEQYPRFRPDDVIVGEFIGDGDLLLVAPSETAHQRILVADEIVSREEWAGVGEDFATFFETYFEARGEKFWDRSGQSGPH